MICFSLSDIPSSKQEYLMDVRSSVVVPGFPGLPLLVWNHYLTCQSQGKGNQALSILSSAMPKIEPSSHKGWAKKGIPYHSVTLGQQKVDGGRMRSALILLFPGR